MRSAKSNKDQNQRELRIHSQKEDLERFLRNFLESDNAMNYYAALMKILLLCVKTYLILDHYYPVHNETV